MWREGEGKRRQGENHPIWTFRELGETLAYGMPRPMRPNPPGQGGSGVRLEVRPAQEFGTIEGRSKGVTTPRGKDCRSPARWNSIRRSNAFKRMMGKRVMTFSRTAR